MHLLWFLPGLLAFSPPIQWQPIMPQFNTGRVYMQRNTPWGAGALGQLQLNSVEMFITYSGPICNSTANYALTGDFFDYVCQENGFDKAVFYGPKSEYLSFMKSRFNSGVGDYFETLYKHDVDLPVQESPKYN